MPTLAVGPLLQMPSRAFGSAAGVVRVFGPDERKLVYLFSIPEWEARDRITRKEAREVSTRKGRRGIQVCARITKPAEHTLQGQLAGWQEDLQRERPDIWVQQGGLARLDQVEGLPVVGDPLKLFYGKQKKAA